MFYVLDRYMMRFLNFRVPFFILLFVVFRTTALCQPCTTAGQTPATAFPVCATNVFQQTNVPICATNDLFVPGCSGTGNALYQNKNPFFYKFTCYTSGTLGFVITPLAANEDYDWQLYDITGKNPNDIFTNSSLVVTGNWSGSYGPTGASSSGINSIQCGSDPSENKPRFAAMPALIAGHEYLLMISHFTDSQSGYTLTFGGGTAVIADPAIPHMQSAVPSCDGTKITLKLNKKILCSSLTSTGSEFSLSIGTATVVAAATTTCSPGFDFNEIILTLSAPLISGTQQLIINNGSDGNTLLDNCGNSIPIGERISFDYFVPQPILADSIGKIKCAPDSILIYYPKKIKCSTVSATGSDFSITGPSVVTVVSASGNCVNDLSDYIVIKFAAPIYTKGVYTLSIQPGIDGSPVFDACGQPLLPQTLSFTTADTVSANFQYNTLFGCQRDTLIFSHNGAHDVNKWQWKINAITASTPTYTTIFPATSSNNIQLIVSNGVCSDTATTVIDLANEVKASFTMPDIICPEDEFVVKNTSTGQIDSWQWKFGTIRSSTLKDPLPVLFPATNQETYYNIKLITTNSSLGCSDSITKKLTVFDNCFIAVPSAFTPNNDGLNDFLWPHNAIKAENLDFKIFTRWGQLIFHSRDWRQKWDGKINGVPQATAVYVWMLSYTHKDTKKQVFQKGTVALLR